MLERGEPNARTEGVAGTRSGGAPQGWGIMEPATPARERGGKGGKVVLNERAVRSTNICPTAGRMLTRWQALRLDGDVPERALAIRSVAHCRLE